MVEFESVDGGRERREISNEELRPYRSHPLGLDTHVHERELDGHTGAGTSELRGE